MLLGSELKHKMSIFIFIWYPKYQAIDICTFTVVMNLENCFRMQMYINIMRINVFKTCHSSDREQQVSHLQNEMCASSFSCFSCASSAHIPHQNHHCGPVSLTMTLTYASSFYVVCPTPDFQHQTLTENQQKQFSFLLLHWPRHCP